ncbi:hypothetical protein NP233_g9325 [Leucocoprinus birnbaumii]|uniref:histone deacetylase n=1 Tax=Leucocoprinus birnbaumii TaxID=56174 RepID=A0AAD5YMB5_9AGAR|nr:hypothetical protein NP233_g9325 [Leucocoprinus birnbaumii]
MPPLPRTPSQIVWLITGGSSGFGLELTKQVLKGGGKVAATYRPSTGSSIPPTLSSLQSSLPASQASNLLLLECDVSSSSQISAAFTATLSSFGRIDVVFNGAAWAILGEIEGTPEDEARRMFDVNFWGMCNVSREAVKVFREVNGTEAAGGRIGGRLLNVSSRSGVVPSAGIGYYCASKHALEGFTEALAKEMDPAWNIQITILEPGPFRTRAHADNTAVFPVHPAYASNTSLASRQLRHWFADKSGVTGDPVLAAERIYRFAMGYPIHNSDSDKDDGIEADVPLRLQLGDGSWSGIKATLEKRVEEMKAVETMAQSRVEFRVLRSLECQGPNGSKWSSLPITMSKRKVAYYYDPDVGSYTYGLGHPMKPHRIRVTHDLVAAYDMLPKMHVLRPKRASPEMLTAFHTDEYVHFLTRVSPETAEELTYHGTRFLVGDDNPAFEGLFEFCSISAGGSICAAQRIASGAADIAINWAGGLHHAKKREASGFCYINDIVLGILELLRSYPRVLYIDIDCHHGDGVEEAFYTNDRVMTCSFHKFGEYFPGTGTQEDKGRGKGRGYAINVPLKDGVTDESFRSVFEPVIAKILDVFQPSAVVLQCGADSLSGDKLGCFNLTMKGHAHCVQFLRQQNIPLILLGGGGYTVKNVARLWTYETACALGIENDIEPSLPWNEYFEWFAPRYRLEVVGNNMDDLNMKDGSLDRVRVTALEQLQEIAHAPSVQMHDVPKESVGHHLGFMKDEEGWDELDERLAQHARYVYTLQESSSASEDEDEDSWESDDSSNSQVRRTRSRSKPSTSANTNANGNATTNGSSIANGTSRKRMSLITNRYFDVPAHENGFSHYDCGAPLGKNTKRRFFNWDEVMMMNGNGGVTMRDAFSPLAKTLSLSGLMERGGANGRDKENETVDDDWDDNNSSMAVDS